MTCLTLVLLGNYAQTGHLGGPLAYTPYKVAVHLASPEFGGLRYDYRRPKHPYADKFMLAAGHGIPTCYALWMIFGQALERKYKTTGDSALLRRSTHRDRRPRFPAGRRRAQHSLVGPRLGRPPVVRPGKGPRYTRPFGALRRHGCYERCQRRSVRDRHCHGCRQGRILGFCGRASLFEGHRAGRGICSHRGARSGVQDIGLGLAGGQALTSLGFRQQRRHRR